MFVLLLVVFITIFISAQCSLYEATLYSTRMGALEAAKTKGKFKGLAQQMISMKKQVSAPIAAILILNTLANTAGATLSGMYAQNVLGTAMVPVFSIVFTLAILFIAEILPKTIGVAYWRTLWPFIVLPLSVIKYVLYPFIKVTQKFTSILTKGKNVPLVTEDEILGVVKLGAREGEISHLESQMVQNIISLEDRKISEIMTPRTVVFSLDEKLSVKEGYEIACKKGFTRIPVYRENRENITGYVMIHDLGSEKIMHDPDKTLLDISKPIAFAGEDEDCLAMLTVFLKKRRHIAIVKDEYAGVAGLVSLEDLLETVLGAEIVDETDKDIDMQKVALNRNKKV